MQRGANKTVMTEPEPPTTVEMLEVLYLHVTYLHHIAIVENLDMGWHEHEALTTYIHVHLYMYFMDHNQFPQTQTLSQLNYNYRLEGRSQHRGLLSGATSNRGRNEFLVIPAGPGWVPNKRPL